MDEIVWLDDALRDLDEIGSYIALDSSHAAELIVRRITEAVSILAWHPRIGRLLADNEMRHLPTHYGNALDRRRERVEILAIFHGKWPDHLD